VLDPDIVRALCVNNPQPVERVKSKNINHNGIDTAHPKVARVVALPNEDGKGKEVLDNRNGMSARLNGRLHGKGRNKRRSRTWLDLHGGGNFRL
jgi:hypothetical protein